MKKFRSICRQPSYEQLDRMKFELAKRKEEREVRDRQRPQILEQGIAALLRLIPAAERAIQASLA